MEIEINKEDKLLRVIASGNFTLESAKKTFTELMEAVEQHQAKKVLFDAREVTGEPTHIERYQYGEHCAEEALKPKSLYTRFAYVMNPPVLDPGRFGETVAVNRGMPVKATDSIEEAMQWLGLAVFPDNTRL